MSKIIEYINSKGNSNIRIRMFESRNILFYKKDILTVYFRELENSYIHYLSGNKDNFTNSSFQEILNGINHGNITLKDSMSLIYEILKEFENGKYNVTIDIANEKSHNDLGLDAEYQSDQVEKIYGTKLNPDYFDGKYSFLGEKEHNSILETISRRKLNHSRIEYYRRIISKGKKPLVILFGVYLVNIDFFEIGRDNVYYLIDGHHKMAAYRSLKINPKVLRVQQIVNQDNFWDFYMNKEEFQKYKDYRDSLKDWRHYFKIKYRNTQ